MRSTLASFLGRKEISRWHLRRFEKVPSSEFRVAAMKKHSGNVQAIAFSMAGLMVKTLHFSVICVCFILKISR